MTDHDPYKPQLEALMSGASRRARSTAERAAFITDLIGAWDHATLGDWRDAVAVAARRKNLHSRKPYVLLARLLWGVDARRGAEIGKIAEKFRTRLGAQLIRDVGDYGGVKRVSRADYTPPKRPRVRKTSQSPGSSGKSPRN